MSVTIQTVTTTLRDALGNAVNGTVSILPMAPWSYNNGADQDRLIAAPVEVTVSNGKVTAFPLPPTTGGGASLTNARYRATYNITGAPTYTEEWIIDAASGTIEWAAIQIADTSLTVPPSNLLPGPQGPQGVPGTSDLMPDNVTPIHGLRAFNGRAVLLAADYALQAWADTLTSGLYVVSLTVAQGNLVPGWWYIEVIRHSGDASGNEFRTLRATRANKTSANHVYMSTDVLGTWSPWHRLTTDAPLAWLAPTLINGWLNYGGLNQALYAQDDAGNVFIKGLVKGGSDTTTTTIFTLPSGMRPLTTLIMATSISGGTGRLQISNAGDVLFVGTSAHTGNANTFVSIVATFKGEQ